VAQSELFARLAFAAVHARREKTIKTTFYSNQVNFDFLAKKSREPKLFPLTSYLNIFFWHLSFVLTDQD
jgi:hypothetical protein